MTVLKLITLAGDTIYYPAHSITLVSVSKTLAKTHIFIAANEAAYFVDTDAELLIENLFGSDDYEIIECKQIKP